MLQIQARKAAFGNPARSTLARQNWSVRFDLTLRGKPDRNSLPAVSRLALTVITALSLIAVDTIWDGRRLSITVDVVLLTVTTFTLTMSASSLTVKKYYDETKDHMSKYMYSLSLSV
ncbi:hypothetical protein POSPLADRAFT_1033303 [Postia placenta MAD-698-R-SB12]|uniref:Uncharacterized protein n=1 Tax=Postia placenta MAD-698-R-SB12 TaxID=670580 RepID=A0A1X6N235_9APHY|nr:hypothetical protein POSPLADRAFT_1033303 [Postia placenta MAD-698-R-SB12]OSX62526.1 hypothetical protein POSPLADRAFT_1033303 [Postia placenta MAD-698-R-SB12]